MRSTVRSVLPVVDLQQPPRATPRTLPIVLRHRSSTMRQIDLVHEYPKRGGLCSASGLGNQYVAVKRRKPHEARSNW
jgi:hypothetical protein